LAAPGVGAPALQPAAHRRGLEERDEPPGPPLLADRAALAPGLDAALDGDRHRRRVVAPWAHAVPPARSGKPDRSLMLYLPLAPGSPTARSCCTSRSLRETRPPAHADTASGDSVSTSRSAAVDRSVSQLSPVP